MDSRDPGGNSTRGSRELSCPSSNQLVTFETVLKKSQTMELFSFCSTTIRFETAAFSVDFHSLPSPLVPKPPNAAFISFALSQPLLPAHTYQCHGGFFPPPFFLSPCIRKPLRTENPVNHCQRRATDGIFFPAQQQFWQVQVSCGSDNKSRLYARRAFGHLGSIS